MMMKKLAIASAITMMGMGAAYAQQTPTTTTSTPETGLMTELSTSLATIFNAGQMTTITPKVEAVTGSAATYATADAAALTAGNDTYSFVNGAYVKDAVPTVGNLYITKAAVTGVTGQLSSTVYSAVNPADITAIAGAVNLSAINGSIDISGTNVSITGVAGDVGAKAEALTSATAFAINGNNFSTTVIGAMNSSTLDIMARTADLSEMTKSTLNIAVLANQGAAPSITTQSFGPADLGLATTGSTILDAAAATTQFNMEGLVSGTETLAESMTEDLQSMNVFNMALNVAPIVAGVKIAALKDDGAWFLNPQSGIVNVSNLQSATTPSGAINSSIPHLAKNLTTLAK
jgi:microcompartment protein CcmL/EutN